MHITIILLLYLMLYASMAIYRMVFYFRYAVGEQGQASELHNAIFTGLRLDMMTTTYLLLPAVVFLIMKIILGQNIFTRLTKWYMLIISIFVAFVISADFAFYRQFNSRITKALFLWSDNIGTSLHFLFTDCSLYPQIVSFVVLSFTFMICVQNVMKIKTTAIASKWSRSLQIIAMAIITIIAMRGGLQTRPLGTRHAFAFNNMIINQFCLNPVMSLYDSYQLVSITEMSTAEALKNINEYWGENAMLQSGEIQRTVNESNGVRKRNVIIIMMESMSGEMMGKFGNPRGHTPFLDSLYSKSICFANMYSMGLHTCNGMFGVLYGMASLGNTHPMASVSGMTNKYEGLPFAFKQQGYRNLFFCTHEPNFDNTENFMLRNNFDKVYSQRNFKPEEIENSWGVSDETLYQFAIEAIDSVSNRGELFFTTILSISTHPPQALPSGSKFKARSSDAFSATYEYADWALSNFFEKIKNKKWFKQTTFLLVGDHGVVIPYDTENIIAQNYTPSIIYEPGMTHDSTINIYCNQSDISPTLLHHLRMCYTTTDLGANIFMKKYDYTYFTRDGINYMVGKRYMIQIDKFSNCVVYDMKSRAPLEHYDTGEVEQMKKYGNTFLQTAQYIISHGYTTAKRNSNNE